MKIKGCAKKLNAKTLILCFGIAGIAFAAFHAWVVFARLEADTGFFTGGSALPVIYYGCLAAIVLLCALLFYLCPLSKAEYIEARRDIPHALASLLLAVGVAYSAWQTMQNTAVSADTGLTGNDTAKVGLSGLASSRLQTLIVVLGFLSCAALLLNAVSFITGGDLLRKLRVLQLFPTLWALFRGLSYFTITVSYIRVPTLLVSIFADVLLMIFLFEYARKVSGVAGDGNSPIYLSTALIASLLQLCAGVASLAGFVPGRTAIVYADFAPYRFAAVVFGVTAVLLMLGNRVPDYVPGGETANADSPAVPPAVDLPESAEPEDDADEEYARPRDDAPEGGEIPEEIDPPEADGEEADDGYDA